MPKRTFFIAILMIHSGMTVLGQSHVAEPAVNLGDSSFLDGVGGPGFLTEQMNDFQHDGRITNSSGQTVRGSGSVNSASGLSHVAWLAHRRILGGWYGMEVVGVEAYVDAGSQGHRGGFGDLTVSPFILQWPEKGVFGIRIDQRFDVDFGVPVGKYSPTSNVNLSSNAFNVQPYYVITAFPKKRIETSWRFHYLWNATNNAPPINTGAQSTQAGQAIHFNATAAYNVYKGLWIGANGYYLKQITDGRINGIPLSNSPEQVGAVGPGMVWNVGHWYYYANFYQEIGAENRPTGPKLVLRIEKVF
ncbi:SphA family protein [Acidicapsa acidisoli]|uniref:SphA family protein n=1 Tax=Acidicapsa acidisoli TaxID=1615681 RepID=UPI0021E02B2F|nr:transporter [Acidicapsa acidisoli]